MSVHQEFVIIIVEQDQNTRLRLEADIKQALQDSMTIESCSSKAEGMLKLDSALSRKAHIPLIFSGFDSSEQDSLNFFRQLRIQWPFLNSFSVLLTTRDQGEIGRRAIEEHLISQFIEYPWQSQDIYRTIKDLLSSYILRYAYDQLPYYESIVSHHHYRKALQESELHRQSLTEEIGRFARNLLDIRRVSDHDLRKQIGEDLRQLVNPEEMSMVFKQYAEGQQILAYGSPNNRLQIILEGTVVHLLEDKEESDLEVFSEEEGAIIGSMSFFSSKPALTSVKAVTPVRALSLDQSILDRAMSNNVHFLISFTNLLLRQVLSRARKHLEINIKLQRAVDELKRTQLQLIESEKLVTLGQLVAGVAHELNNPAAAIVRSVDHMGSFIKTLMEEPANLNPILHKKAMEAFDRGRELKPLSTRDMRSKSQPLAQHLQSSYLAKQAVEMGLDQVKLLIQLANDSQLSPTALIDYLNRYYQIGHFMRNIEASGGRIEALVRSLKSYARQETGLFEWLDVHVGIEESLLILQHRVKHFELIKEYGELPKIVGLPASLNQVWTNLIANALDAMGENGRLLIRTEYQKDENLIKIYVRDNGPGISPENMDKIFAINFTTKRGTGFGLGLGLAICKSIIDKHKGSIEVKSEPGSYAEFIVSLPVGRMDA